MERLSRRRRSDVDARLARIGGRILEAGPDAFERVRAVRRSRSLNMDFFWELRQAPGIAQAQRDADRAGDRATEAGLRLREVELRANKALLACEAIWTLLRDKVGLSESELLDRIRELDLTDGKLDGRARRTLTTCPQCNRDTTQRFSRCVYCGADVPASPFAG